MKTKLEASLLVIVLILDICLLNVNLNNRKYTADSKKDKATANYIEVVKADNETEDKIEEKTIEVVEEKVYDDMTLDELSDKLNKSLNSTISNKGSLIASYSLEKGVDPYLATAIILHETGCTWECSYNVNVCNNVGGQKGSGCGSYAYFDTLDNGIKAFIDNLHDNYISYGLTTAELINPKYAASTAWASNVNKYIDKIKAQ